MIFGILATKSIHITEITRNLHEPIKTKETANHLYENLDKLDYKILWENHRENLKPKIDDDTLFHIDNSDVV